MDLQVPISNDQPDTTSPTATTPSGSEPPGRTTRRARLAIVGAAGLLATIVGLEFAVGEPPVDGDELLTWMDTNRLGLILLDEALVFGGLALAAAAATARNAVGPRLRDRLGPVVGVAMLATVIMFVTALAGGRFVYPVHDIAVEDPDSAALVAGLFYGGMHMFWLAMAVLALTVIAATRRHCGTGITIASAVAAGSAIAASYPEMLGPELTLAIRLVVVAWMLVLAATLPTRPPAPTSYGSNTDTTSQRGATS